MSDFGIEGSAAKFTRMKREVSDLRTAVQAEATRADKAEAACRSLSRELERARAAMARLDRPADCPHA